MKSKRVLSLVLAGACGPLAGCSTPETPQSSKAGDATVVSLPQTPGLEAHLWLTRADSAALDSALSSYAPTEEQVSPDTLHVWAANGLRIFAFPESQLPQIQSALNSGPAASRQSQQIQPDARWAELVRGPSVAAQTIAFEGERVRLPSGSLRMLGRCWAVPLPPREDGADAPAIGLHVSILPQHADNRQAVLRDPLEPAPTSIDPADAGLNFERLMLTLTARPGAAYLIIAERPALDWSRPPTTSTSAEPSTDADQPKVGRVDRGRNAPGAVDAFAPFSANGAAGTDQSAGPRSLAAPSLGEAMLMGDATRVVLAIVPRVPESFTLTGQPAAPLLPPAPPARP